MTMAMSQLTTIWSRRHACGGRQRILSHAWSGLELFPNPVKDVLNVKLPEGGVYGLTLTSVSGQTVEATQSSVRGQLTWDVSIASRCLPLEGLHLGRLDDSQSDDWQSLTFRTKESTTPRRCSTCVGFFLKFTTKPLTR